MRCQQGYGGPTFCWHCNRQLQRVEGEKYKFYYVTVEDPIGHTHRIHMDCLEESVAAGNRLKGKEE